MSKSLLLPALLFSITTITVSRADETLADSTLVSFTQQRTNAIRITRQPARMADGVATLCDAFPHEKAIADKQNPHREKFVHVFVSPQGAPAMRTNSAVFPTGTIILKEKFGDAAGRNTELFTGMLKREAGYNPKCGDWEFFTLSADAKKVNSRGKLQNCMECHIEYKDSDFVTKHYSYFGF